MGDGISRYSDVELVLVPVLRAEMTEHKPSIRPNFLSPVQSMYL